MHNNGTSHAVVPDDFEGVVLMLQWLSYMPKVGLFHMYKSNAATSHFTLFIT